MSQPTYKKLKKKTSSHSNYVIKVFRFVCNLMPWGESCRNGQHTKRPLQGTGILSETSALLLKKKESEISALNKNVRYVKFSTKVLLIIFFKLRLNSRMLCY